MLALPVFQTPGSGDRGLAIVPKAEPSPIPGGDFRVGDWLVQPSLCRVARGDEVVRLRPQLMDVLVCLATRPGRTIMKQEMLDTVWSGHYVSESALARCIAELRQALGDDARAPKLIETISKRGYRMIAPITTAASPAAVPPAVDQPQDIDGGPVAAGQEEPLPPSIATAVIVLVALIFALLAGWALT
jgi:DNA-binding winged helix-turn-helix (wHTH) protein